MTAPKFWNLDRRIASDCKSGNKIVLHIVENLQRIGWSEAELFGIHMALEEAVINAIKHGNKEDPAREVHILVEATSASFVLRVTDEGEGFDPCCIPDCTADENLEVCSGRGLMLMHHYMDAVNYNEIGNSVEIRKKR
jgi:serine/threonine-protein kinase RsbW